MTIPELPTLCEGSHLKMSLRCVDVSANEHDQIGVDPYSRSFLGAVRPRRPQPAGFDEASMASTIVKAHTLATSDRYLSVTLATQPALMTNS
jgi:hypothetical protein